MIRYAIIRVFATLILLGHVLAGCSATTPPTTGRQPTQSSATSAACPQPKTVFQVDSSDGVTYLISDPCRARFGLADSKGRILIVNWNKTKAESKEDKEEVVDPAVKALQDSGYEVQVLRNETAGKVKQAIKDFNPDVLHIESHGNIDGDGTSFIRVIDKNYKETQVPKADFAEALAAQNPGAIFSSNACKNLESDGVVVHPNPYGAYSTGGNTLAAIVELKNEGVTNPTADQLWGKLAEESRQDAQEGLDKVFNASAKDRKEAIDDFVGSAKPEARAEISDLLNKARKGDTSALEQLYQHIQEKDTFTPEQFKFPGRDTLFPGPLPASSTAPGMDVSAPAIVNTTNGTSDVYQQTKAQIASGELKPVGQPDAAGFQAYKNDSDDTRAFLNTKTPEYQVYEKSDTQPFAGKEVWYNRVLGNPLEGGGIWSDCG